MNGKEILIDTNIALYLLKGNDILAEFLQDKIVYISFINELELIGFKNLSAKEEENIAEFLKQCTIVSLNDSIKKTYIQTRRKTKLKLADSIIAATTLYLNIPLISADNHFKAIENLDLIFFQMS